MLTQSDEFDICDWYGDAMHHIFKLIMPGKKAIYIWYHLNFLNETKFQLTNEYAQANPKILEIYWDRAHDRGAL